MSQSSLSKSPNTPGTVSQDPSHPEPDRSGDQHTPASVDEIRQMEEAPIEHGGRQGFLPMRTNAFDRVFISIVLFVAIHLLWMRFVEMYLPLWVATILTVLLGIWIIRRG